MRLPYLWKNWRIHGFTQCCRLIKTNSQRLLDTKWLTFADRSNERLSQSQIANTGLSITSVALGASEYKQYQGMTMAALGLRCVQYGVVLPYGRTQESEADIVGLEYMAQAFGSIQKQSVDLWQTWRKHQVGTNQSSNYFLRTLPTIRVLKICKRK